MQQGHVLRRLCRQGNTELVSQMLDAGIAVDVPQEDGCTGLWLAAEHGCTDVARLLLSRHANPNAVKAAGNISVLFISAQNGHVPIVDLLLHHGANPNLCKSSGASPLFIAAQQNHPEIVRSLLRAGANHSSATSNGVTPLMIAAFQGNMQVAKLLLAAGADPHAVGQGKNAIEWAAENRHRDEMQRLVEDHLRTVQTEIKRKRMADAFDTPLVARGMHDTPVASAGTPMRGDTSMGMSRGASAAPMDSMMTPMAGGGGAAVNFSGYTPRYLTAPSVGGTSHVAPMDTSLHSAPSVPRGGSPRRHFNTRSFSDPIPAGIGEMTPVTGTITSQALTEELRRSNDFRKWVKRDATAVKPPPKLDWTTSTTQGAQDLNRPLYITEAQWQAHKQRLDAQTVLDSEVRTQLSDSWMYTNAVTTAYARQQDVLRAQAAEADRHNREQLEMARRTSTEVGFSFPHLPAEKMERLKDYMAVGRGAMGPPPPLDPEPEPEPQRPAALRFGNAFSNPAAAIVSSIAAVAADDTPSSPRSAAMSKADKLRAQRAARGS